jgi:hypothetical protein
VLIGHIPFKLFCVHGSRVSLKMDRPYAETSIPKVTLPWMEETPTTSKVSVKLSGVKTTLKRLAVKLELSWHALRDFDSINRMAEVPERRERKDVSRTKGESDIEDRMVVFVC